MSDAPDGPVLPLPGVDRDGDDDGDGVPTFDEPWQARAFGVAVALAEGRDLDAGEGGDEGDARGYDWAAFRSRLIEAVGDDRGHHPDATGGPAGRSEGPTAVDGAYYRQWLTALERLLDEHGLVAREEVAERAAEFAAGDRDASEFVAGDR